MTKFFLVNTILNKLPISLFGITYRVDPFTGRVYPKFDIILKRSELSLP